MAITDAGQILESTSLSRVNRITLTGASKAGALMGLGLAGRVTSGTLSLSGITDSQGNSWDWFGQSSGYRAAYVGWNRSAVPMATTDWIEVTWSKTPELSWITGHSFEGASGAETDEDLAQGSPSTVASETVSVVGSDYLVLSTIAYAYSSTTTTALNSGIEQDTFDGGNLCAEFLSRNGTTGSTYTAGTTFASSRYWTIAVVSFPSEAMPASGRSMPFMVGI